MRPLVKQIGITFLILLGSQLVDAETEGETAGLQPFVDWLLADEERLEDVPFAEVVEAVSGFEVLLVDADQVPDAFILRAIQEKADAMLIAFSEPGHPVHQAGRINETSRFIESFFLEQLNAVEGLRCTIPATASGKAQRSGYPDLRIEHQASGRVFYLDPKVYKATSERSSFRSFYFQPKRETNKILDDASHVILGVAHKGKSETGLWQFEKWQLIDLAHFRVRLKAEFQGSNRDLYREDAVVLKSSVLAAPEPE